MLDRSSEWSGLMTASFNGDIEWAENLLKGNVDIDQQEPAGFTALMLASYEGHSEVVKLLVDNGAQVNLQKSDGVSALMLACKCGHAEVVSLLLDNGALVNMQNAEGMSSLMMASDEDELQLQERADVNMAGEQAAIHDKPRLHDRDDVNTADLDTATLKACEYKCPPVAKLLIERGAQLDLRNKFGTTALMKASYYHYHDMVKLLLESGATIDLQNDHGETALMKARDVRVAKLLLDYGAQVSTQDINGESALTFAICNNICNLRDIAQLLLDHGAQVNMQNSDGKSPLIIAIDTKNMEIAKLLLSNCAEVDLLTDDGPSALMAACINADSKMVGLLLDNGATVNLQNSDGISALMASCTEDEECSAVATKLLQNGAEVDLISNDGVSALMLACDHGNIRLAQLLLDGGACINLQDCEGLTSLTMAVQNESLELVQFLLQNGARVDVKDEYGVTPLMTATKEGFMQISDCLIDYGSQIDLRDKDGKSALIYAAENKSADFTSRLIELGAQIDLQDSRGLFPLMYAVKAGDAETAQMLLAHGANVHLRNWSGQTILDVCPKECMNLPLFQELFQTLLKSANDALEIDPRYPGIVFYKAPVSVCVTSSGATTMDRLHDMGISITIPENSLSPDEDPLDIHLRPCFRGPFGLPKKYRSASPAYLISHSRKANFQMDITVRIQHHARLGNEEDCDGMTFLSASSTPEFRESRPAYTFKKICGAKTRFAQGDQVGEISLRHFCLVKVVTEKNSENQQLYSVRLYRNVQYRGAVSAVFCVCLVAPIYIQDHGSIGEKSHTAHVLAMALAHSCFLQHCDSVMAHEYSGMSGKGEGRSQVYAQIVGDRVMVHSSVEASNITFDRNPTQILKRDIQLPEKMKVDVSQLLDYPPRLLVYYMHHNQPCLGLPELQVTGLDIEHSFVIITQSFGASMSRLLWRRDSQQQAMSVETTMATGSSLPIPATPVSLLMQSQPLASTEPYLTQSPPPHVSSVTTVPPLLVSWPPLKSTSSVSPRTHFPDFTPSPLSQSQPPLLPATQSLPTPSPPGHPGLPVQPLSSRHSSAQAEMVTRTDISPLGLDDLGDVLEAVEPLSIKWRRLSTKLRLRESALDVIECNHLGDVGACLHRALGEWLRLNYDHQKHGRPSWRRLAEAVRSLDYSVFEMITKAHACIAASEI